MIEIYYGTRTNKMESIPSLLMEEGVFVSC
jgi:hypothetical protein